MTSPQERREAKRVKFIHAVTLYDEDKQTQWEGEIDNISIKGVCVKSETACPFDEGYNPHYRIVLAEPETDYEIVGVAKVVWRQSEKVVGIKFLEISLDGLTHLKRLVELNVEED